MAVTGAAKPQHVEGFDGRANVLAAARTVLSPALQPWALGTVVTMDDTVHAARYVRKADSALQAGMFQSHPGPLAQIRGGAVHAYAAPSLPPLQRCLDASLPPHGGAAPRVGLWTMSLAIIES